jgi:hypothetical protein
MVLAGLGVFWGVLEAHPLPPYPTQIHPPSTHPEPTTLHHKKFAQKTQKVCTENLTKSPKYDNIKAVLVEINRTERGAQTPEKKTKKTKKERKLQ